MIKRTGERYEGNWQAVVSGSNFVSAEEIGDAVPTLTVDDVRVAVVESLDPGSPAADKLVVYFVEAKKGWIINSTNGKCLGAMFGNDVRGWRGKRVTLVVEPVKFGGKTLPGIRIKGSPDIAAPIDVDVTLPRRRKTMRKLVPTGKPQEQRRQPDPEDEDGQMGWRE